jgi:hypothetical protein
MVFIACAALLGLASLREVCVGGIIAYVIHSDDPELCGRRKGQTSTGVPATATKP